jgi:hypothetical protein
MPSPIAGLGGGFQFNTSASSNQYLYDASPRSDIEELERIAGREGRATDERLSGELAGIGAIASRQGEEAAVADASAAAQRASDNDAAQFERATRGMDLSPRQKKSASRRLGLTRSLNRAAAAGDTRRGFTDRSKAAASAGSGFSDALFSQRVTARTGLATAEGARISAEAQRKANKKASTIGLIGSVVGAGLAFFSSEELKHDRGHEGDLLAKLKNVRVNRWQYKGDDKTHVGPFSEEFNREFGIDTDRPDMINVIDALGVTLGAVKELDKKISHGR